MKIFVFALAVFCAVVQINSMSLNPADLTKSIIDVSKGMVEKIPSAIPAPNDLFQLGKNAIAGYPFDAAAKAINSFCKPNFVASGRQTTKLNLICHSNRQQVAPHYQLTL